MALDRKNNILWLSVRDLLNKKELFESDLRITKIVCGVAFTFVVIDDKLAGLARTECDFDYIPNKQSVFYPGNILNKSVFEILTSNEFSKISNSIKVAIVNALYSSMLTNCKCNKIFDTDPIDLVDLAGKRIVVVGAFNSYINKLHSMNANFEVLELNKNAIKKEFQQYYRPASTFKKAFQNSDIIFLTSSTLVNQTIDKLLQNLPQKSINILVGPSCCLEPNVLFSKNISLLATIKINDIQKTYEIISQGGSAKQLYETKAAQKICLVNENKKHYFSIVD